MKAKDHKSVGEKMGECIQAYLEREGRRDSEEELRKYIEKKWSKAAGKDGDVLSLSDDLAASLWYAKDYTKTKGVKKGKVVELEANIVYNGDYVATNALWIPKKYNAKESYPLIFCLPDVGEDPEKHLNEQWVLPALRDGAILVALDLPDKTDNWGTLGVKGETDEAGGVAILMTVFAVMRDSYAIDFDRIYIAGRGAGVAAAMQIAETAPDRFAGVIGRAGDAAEMAPTNMNNLPCYFAGAGGNATAFADASKEAEYVESTVNPGGTLDDIWAWMAETTRNANPETIQLVPGKPSRKAYWLELPSAEYLDDASLTATVNREANTITIDATGVQSVTIYFNDSLVNLDEKVKVVINGAVHEDLIPRNFYSMMEQIYRGRSDSGKLYTAFKVYDVPASSN